MENIKFVPGDLVKYRGIIFQVDKISLHSPSVTLTKENKQDPSKFVVVETELSKIRGIPLSHEILEKNGWEKNEFEVYVRRVSLTFTFLSKLSNGDWSVCLCRSKLINCKFVHQLQHLLFGLGLDNNLKI